MVGYALARRGTLKQATFDRIMVATIVLMAPPLAMLSVWVIELDVELVWLPLLGVAMQLIPGGASLVWARTKFSSNLERGSYVLSNMLSNRGVVGLLTVFILFGETGFAYCFLVTLFSSFVVYLLCFPMANYFRALGDPQGVKHVSFRSILLNPKQMPILGIALGMVLNLANVERPAVLGNIFPFLLHFTFWGLVLPLGASIDFSKMKKYWLPIADSLFIKFVITPASIYALAFLVGLRGVALYTVVVLSCSPTAINAVLTSRLFKLNVHLAMATFLLTMAVYLAVVLPIIFLLA